MRNRFSSDTRKLLRRQYYYHFRRVMKSKHVVVDKSKQQSSDLASNSRSPVGRPINHTISIPDTCVIRRTFQRRNERMNISVWYRESAPGGQFTLIYQLAPCGWHSTSICICLSILTLRSETPVVILREHEVKLIARQIEVPKVYIFFWTCPLFLVSVW